MLGSIGSDQDIDVYFVEGEISELEGGEPVVGTIIELQDPKKQHPLNVSLDKEAYHPDTLRKSRSGIGVEWQDRKYSIYVHLEFFEILKKNGVTGTRYDSFGSKANLWDVSKIKEFGDRQAYDHLVFYFKNKERLKTPRQEKIDTPQRNV